MEPLQGFRSMKAKGKKQPWTSVVWRILMSKEGFIDFDIASCDFQVVVMPPDVKHAFPLQHVDTFGTGQQLPQSPADVGFAWSDVDAWS